MTSRLSDPGTRHFKVRQTWTISLLTVALCALQSATSPVRPPAWAVALIVLVVAALVTYTLRHVLWHLADEVGLEADRLVVRRGNQKVSIPAANVADVVLKPFSLRRAAVIVLRQAAQPFGERISFLPLGWNTLRPPQADQFAVLLKERLAELSRSQRP